MRCLAERSLKTMSCIGLVKIEEHQRYMAGPMKAPAVFHVRWKPNTRALISGVASSDKIASCAAVRLPLPKRSSVRAKKITASWVDNSQRNLSVNTQKSKHLPQSSHHAVGEVWF
jgi:hypothetical protein